MLFGKGQKENNIGDYPLTRSLTANQPKEIAPLLHLFCWIKQHFIYEYRIDKQKAPIRLPKTIDNKIQFIIIIGFVSL